MISTFWTRYIGTVDKVIVEVLIWKQFSKALVVTINCKSICLARSTGDQWFQLPTITDSRLVEGNSSSSRPTTGSRLIKPNVVAWALKLPSSGKHSYISQQSLPSVENILIIQVHVSRHRVFYTLLRFDCMKCISRMNIRLKPL